jgi:hypothetical protein
MADERYKVDTDNYLSYDYDEYRNSLYALALTKPSEYFKLRASIMKAVKTKAVGNIYENFYNVLSKGIVNNNQMLEEVRVGGPAYPQQLVNKIALKAAKTLDIILNDVIEIILPQDYKTLANLSMVTKTKADAIN